MSEKSPLLPKMAKKRVFSAKIVLFMIVLFGILFVQFQSMYKQQKPKLKPDPKIVLNHLKNLQKIARENGESRSVINGHLASVAYVVENINKYNKTWKVWTEDVVVNVQVDKRDPKLEISFANEKLSFLPRIDLGTQRGSGSISGVFGLKFFHGCNFTGPKGDWAAVIDSTISTVECSSCQRMLRSIELGAKAVIFVGRPGNQDGYPHSMPPAPGRCGRMPLYQEAMSKIAAVSLGDEAAFKLLSVMGSHTNVSINIDVETKFEQFVSKNVLADTISGDKNQVVIFGSHLDGVTAGPGINDDGSGSMGTLELARTLAESSLAHKTKPTIRLAFWTAEEIGLVGSSAYVSNLLKNNPNELKRIKVSIDTDMIGNKY